MKKEIKKNRMANFIKRPVLWGIIAGASLLTIYFLILTLANSFSHSIEQFKEMWYWIAVPVLGFGIQAGLYSYVRKEIKLRKHPELPHRQWLQQGGSQRPQWLPAARIM